MTSTNVLSKQPFVERLSGYLQDADYRVASSKQDRDTLYQLRYKAYRREDTILENAEKRFSDDYDLMDNCWLFGVHHNGRLVSSIRFHIISPQHPKGPAYDVFPDIVRPMISAGKTIVDPTRLVVDRPMTEFYPELAYVTIRAAFMAAEYFEAEYMLATVRQEHQAFYKKLFGFKALCEPRPYPSLLKPISLLAANMPTQRDSVVTKFPIFLSSFTERRMLFQQNNQALDEPEYFLYAVNGGLQ